MLRLPPMRAAVLLACLVASPLLVAAARPALAQAAQPPLASCTYDECALRVEPGGFLSGPLLLRGAGATLVARGGVFGFDLPWVVQESDSAVRYARQYRVSQRRSGTAALLGTAATVTAVVVGYTGDAHDATPYSIAATAFGLYAGYEGARALRALARGVWWYNRALPR